MSSDENKRQIQEVFERLSAGDTQPYLDVLADDIRWTVLGTTKWSGTYHGKQDVISRLLRPLGALLVPRYTLKVHALVAENDMLVVELRGENTTKSGKPYNNSYCWVCRMRAGKICELMEYADTELITAALSG